MTIPIRRAVGLVAALVCTSLVASTSAATAASPVWSTPPVFLSDADHNVPNVEVALSQSGTTAVAVWPMVNGSAYDLYAAVATTVRATTTWSTPVIVDSSPARIQAPQVAVSSTGGVAIVAFRRDDDAGSVIRVASASITGGAATWGTPVAVSGVGGDGADVALSANGTRATVTWTRSGIVESVSGIVSGTSASWSSITEIGADDGLNGGALVEMSTDGTRATAIWARYPQSGAVVQTASATIDGTSVAWSGTTDLSDSSKTLGDVYDLALSANGAKAVVTWYYQNAAVVVRSGTINGLSTSWDSPTTLSGDSTQGPQVAISADGSRATASWAYYGGDGMIIQSASAITEGSSLVWSTPVGLSAPGGQAQWARLALSADGGTAVAAWFGPKPNEYQSYVQTASAVITGSTAVWSMPVDLAPNSSFPSIGLSSDGTRGVAVWTAWDNSHNRAQSSSIVPEITIVPQDPRPIGQWKRKVGSAPLPTTLGNFSVTDPDTARSILRSANCGVGVSDAVGCLAGQLLVAKWNIASDVDGACVETAIGQADALLATTSYAGPGRYSLTRSQRVSALRARSSLSVFNGRGCSPGRVTSPSRR